MDPSPFHERDLDDDAEEFIVGWAREFPRRDPVSLVVHVDQLPPHGDAQVCLKPLCIIILPIGQSEPVRVSLSS